MNNTVLLSGRWRGGSISGSLLVRPGGPDRAPGNPPGTSAEKGVFAIRSPDRPNPVSLCMVDLLEVKDSVLKVRGLDAFDGTPVIDIKVYSAEIDCAGNR